MARRKNGIRAILRSRLTWSLAALVTLGMMHSTLSDVAAAEQPRFGRRGPGGMRNAAMLGLRQLDLTDAQRDAIRDLMEAHRSELREIQEQSAPIREALRDATQADVIDEALIRHHSTQLAETQGEMAVARARIRVEVFEILTPEQQAKARELQAERERRIEERRSRRANR